MYGFIALHPALVGVGSGVGGVVLHHAGHLALQVGFGLFLAAGRGVPQQGIFFRVYKTEQTKEVSGMVSRMPMLPTIAEVDWAAAEP